MAYASMPPQE